MDVLFIGNSYTEYNNLPQIIGQSYRNAAQQIGASIAPVGPAWTQALKRDPELQLYEADRSHPTLLGSYIGACVFYTTLTSTSPVGLSNEVHAIPGVRTVVDAEVAALLQESALAAWASEVSDGYQSS